MDDRYTWWRNALSGEVGPIHEGHPNCGFYKKRQYDPSEPYIAPIKRPWIPCAIWFDDQENEYKACENGKNVDPYDLWLWVAKKPISEKDFRYYETHNKWPENIS